MDVVQLVPPEVLDALGRGAIVVTGNQRAARTLRRGFDELNRQRGLHFWEPAKILSWEAWTSSLWRALVLEGQVRLAILNRSQELAVWREVLREDASLASLRSLDSLAEMAAHAWKLLCAYDGRSRLRDFAVNTDSRAFLRWSLAFERRCKGNEWLSHAALEGALQEIVDAGARPVEEREIVLVGFASLTPSQKGLLESLQAAGTEVGQVELEALSREPMLIAAADGDDELLACSQWIRGVLEQNPAARVGVVVPGLEAMRPEIDRVFGEELAPELEDIRAVKDAGRYEFSVGQPLASMPMVDVALELLVWASRPLPLGTVSRLLLSPYFAEGRGDVAQRARFDAFVLRQAKLLVPEISIEFVLGLVEKARGLERVGGALRRMRVWMPRLVSREVTQTRSYWADVMRELLGASGWGAGEGQDSVEFQTRMKWESALDELTTLDFDGSRVVYGEALEEIGRIARQTLFAPESRDAPVQVIGPLEAVGSQFDALWFLRASEVNWPIATSGSPLLPWRMQRELGMPGVDADVDLAFAHRVTKQVVESAGAAVLSYARSDREGTRQRPSAVVRDLALEESDASEMFSERVREVVAAETVADNVQFPELPDRVMRGGAALLGAQAACGFKAFAERRLWSNELDVAELGMDAAERGTIVHRVMEIFWKNVKTQSELKQMSTSEREEVMEWCIGQVVKLAPGSNATPWEEAYLDMEQKRLQRLLGEWLMLELKRPPFEVKLSEKRFEDVHVGPLRLRVIVDRVDLVEDGEEIFDEDGAPARAEMILDYKTGEANPTQWLGERPDAPQLPLYAILSKAPHVAGVAFAKVRLGEDMALHGYATRGDLLTKPVKLRDASTLELQLDTWAKVLTRLAEEFAAGDARVRPKQYPATCKRCAQRLVCRLDAAVLEADGDDSGDTADE